MSYKYPDYKSRSTRDEAKDDGNEEDDFDVDAAEAEKKVQARADKLFLEKSSFGFLNLAQDIMKNTM
jgi:hypothetical protein